MIFHAVAFCFLIEQNNRKKFLGCFWMTRRVRSSQEKKASVNVAGRNEGLFENNYQKNHTEKEKLS